MKKTLYLAADIGATHTRLALSNDGNPHGLGAYRHYRNDGFASFVSLLTHFWQDYHRFAADSQAIHACFAVAGPIHGRVALLTNRAWQIDADGIAGHFGFDTVILVNDFFAAATAVSKIASADTTVLQNGMPHRNAPHLVIGPGTGLGVAFIMPDGSVHASEGGHIGFAPQNEWQHALLLHLASYPGPLQLQGDKPPLRVNVERLLSGSGLCEIYRYLNWPAEPDCNSRQIIAAAQAAQPDSSAVQALDHFAAIFGAVCGDLALVLLAYGGVSLVGSLANSLRPWLACRDIPSPFIRAFNAKAEHTALATSIAVRLVGNTEAGLSGALLCAQQNA